MKGEKMEKLIVYLIVILLVLSSISGCAPSYCNPNSPDYNPQAAQQWQQQWQDYWRQVNENYQRQLDRQPQEAAAFNSG